MPLLTFNRSSLAQSVFRIISLLIIWMLFANVSFNQFFLNPQLRQLTLIGLILAVLLNEVSSPIKTFSVIAVSDVLLVILLGFLYFKTASVNIWLILIDFLLANVLLLSKFIDEPHCRWIIYGFISGTGLVFLFNLSYHHYFSLVSLMYITLMIFANIFFSYYAFMKKGSQFSMVIICVLILLLCLTLEISFFKLLLITIVLAFYIFFESKVNQRNHEKRANVSRISFLLFSMFVVL